MNVIALLLSKKIPRKIYNALLLKNMIYNGNDVTRNALCPNSLYVSRALFKVFISKA